MTDSKRIRVMYVVPDLGIGGAERHVTTLMPNLDRSRFDAAVVCIGAEGRLFGDLAGSGTKAVALHRTKRQALRALHDLTREMRGFAPDVVITRGYNAEMLGRVAAWLTRVPESVVWVHNHSDTEPRGAVRRMADRMLDRVTSAYFGVANAQTDYLVNDLKYSPDKIRIIHNGVDPDGFQWTDERTRSIRSRNRRIRQGRRDTRGATAGKGPCQLSSGRTLGVGPYPAGEVPGRRRRPNATRDRKARRRTRSPRLCRSDRVPLGCPGHSQGDGCVRPEFLQRRVLSDGAAGGDGGRSAGGVHGGRGCARDD